MKHSTPFWAGLALFVALGTSAVAGPLKVGVTPGALADSAEIAAKEARAQGLDVKVVEFTEWTTPNTALASGDLDLNYFQHQAFLDNANKQAGFKLGSIGVGLQGGFGIFSRKFKTLAELPHGARVAIANDPSNQARALSALQEAGLIKLKPDAPQLASLRDVGDNPKGLKFIEIQGPQLARSLDDVDAVLTAPRQLRHRRPAGCGEISAVLHPARITVLGHPVRHPGRQRDRPAHRQVHQHLPGLGGRAPPDPYVQRE